MNAKTLWITQTAIFTALLIVIQAATAPLKNTIITGSLVNFILIAAAVICGLSSGVTVAVVSPILAKFFGIGPLWGLISFIALGNITLVAVWYFVAGHPAGKTTANRAAAMFFGATGKFLVLYIGIVKFAVPFLLNLPEKQALAISATFSLPQFLTALVGGGLAFVLLPALQKAIKTLPTIK